MAEELGFFPIRWTERFLRADAEQPAGTMQMVLSQIRKNQWVLLEWRLRTFSQFYPVKKGELLPRLEAANPETPVVQVLGLGERSSSQAVRASENIKLFTARPVNEQEPWLPRKVLLDAAGSAIAIGVPVIPRGASITGVRETPDRFMGPGETSNRFSIQVATDLAVQGPLAARQAESPRAYEIVRIFYGTDRFRDDGANTYSNHRDIGEKLRFGICDVTIPRDHKMAKLESPRWWRFEFRWNPAKHVTLQRIRELPEEEFFSLLHNYIGDTVERSAFVFIHGFDVSFEDAARRTAQLSYDLGFKGAPILYSWPSAASFKKYLADEATIEWTKPHLANFLSEIAKRSGATTLHVIAHSMGNRALVKVLENISAPSNLHLFSQVVLTAPDIDSGEFLQLAASIQAAAQRITLYASSNDRAIKISKELHEYPRAGESGPAIVVTKGLDTVDASRVDTSFVGHSYFADKRTVLSDLFYLLQDGKDPDQRHGLEPKMSANGQYWAFKP